VASEKKLVSGGDCGGCARGVDEALVGGSGGGMLMGWYPGGEGTNWQASCAEVMGWFCTVGGGRKFFSMELIALATWCVVPH